MRTRASEHIAGRARIGSAIVCGAIAVLLMLVVLDLPREPGGLTVLVMERIGLSGVEHPVTAVLLNFRGYDTWLELAVLLLGLAGVLAVRGDARLRSSPTLPAADPVLGALIRLLLPLMVLVAGYLLWLGKYEAGGAFQAGVVAGVALVLLWLAGMPSVTAVRDRLIRVAASAGFLAFLVVAVITVVATGVMLELPPVIAGDVILVIEIFAAVSIGFTLAALLIGMQAVPETGRAAP